jgi:hypothetical protein
MAALMAGVDPAEFMLIAFQDARVRRMVRAAARGSPPRDDGSSNETSPEGLLNGSGHSATTSEAGLPGHEFEAGRRAAAAHLNAAAAAGGGGGGGGIGAAAAAPAVGGGGGGGSVLSAPSSAAAASDAAASGGSGNRETASGGSGDN